MEQEQEDRRPTDSDVPTKKQRLNRPRLTPLQNPYNIMNWLPANQVNQRMVDFEQQQQQAYDINEQQQAGRRRKRRTKRRTSKKSRKSRRKYRR